MSALPPETTARTVARILLETGAVLIRPEAPFTLTSGEKSPVYVDCRKLIAFPRARRFIVNALADTACRMCGFESLDGVAGGETAGIPYAAWVAEAQTGQEAGMDAAMATVPVVITVPVAETVPVAITPEAVSVAEIKVSAAQVETTQAVNPPKQDLGQPRISTP